MSLKPAVAYLRRSSSKQEKSIAEQRKYQAQRDNSLARHTYIIRHLRLKSVAGLLTAEDLSVVNQLLE